MAFSFFMRDQQILEQAVEHLLTIVSGRSRVRVWNAGCAHGQETYSFAMLLAERMNKFGWNNLRIDASDHDRENRFGDVVSAGVYHFDQLKRIPAELFAKYFINAMPGYHRVSDVLLDRVRFIYHDLLTLEAPGSDYCMILCKNVLLHFSHEERVSVFRMFHGALASGGLLVNENTQSLPDEVSGLFTRVSATSRIYRKAD